MRAQRCRPAVLVGLAVLSGLLAVASPATAAPVAGTVDIADGDGYTNAAEAFSNMPVTWQASDPTAVSATVWFEDASANIPAGCGPWTVPPTGAGYLNATCASNLPQGTYSFRATWSDGMGDSPPASDSSFLDTVAPALTVDLLDGDGLVTAGEAAAGVSVTWSMTDGESGPGSVTITLAPTGGSPPSSCVLGGLGPSGSTTVPQACFADLPDGPVTITATGADVAGNPAAPASDTTFNRTVLMPFTIEILDGPEDPSTGHVDTVANIEETDGGAALKVRADLDPAMGSNVVTLTVTITDHNGATASASKPVAATMPAEDRTVSVDVRALADGPITATAVLDDGMGNTKTATATSTLDLHAPQTTWGTTDGATFITVRAILFNITTVDLTGTSRDDPPTSPIQFVYLSGRNVDNNDRLSRTAVMAVRGQTETGWELRVPLSAGHWVLHAQAQDEAGNLEPKSAANTIEVDVIGPM